MPLSAKFSSQSAESNAGADDEASTRLVAWREGVDHSRQGAYIGECGRVPEL
nr:hypothetical protein ICEMyc226_00292 [Mycolicibacterium sp.]